MINTIYPQAVQIGIPKKEFWHMTPKDFEIAVKAYNEKLKMRNELEEVHLKQQEYIAWLSGLYIKVAVASVFGGRRSTKYPNKPWTDKSDSIEEIARRNGKDVYEMKMMLSEMNAKVNATNARIENLSNEQGAS